jgi:hypothetical protein
MAGAGRIVTLVLVTPDGTLLGNLPAFEVESPWWQEVGEIVRATRALYGINVTILRLLKSERPRPPGGQLEYLAEVERMVQHLPLREWQDRLDEHPLRMPWARPGGPAAILAWADLALAARSRERIGRAEQVRTWNLSSLWRLAVKGQTVWLKSVPPFFAHEAAILDQLQGQPVPRLLASSAGNMLLAEIEGEDQYQAPLPRLIQMVSLLVELQRKSVGRADALLSLGLPDMRLARLSEAIRSVVERTAAELTVSDRSALEDFVVGLSERFAALAAAGLAETLVHGDFHPGNLRGTAESLVLLDWGDSCVGHPLLDQAAFLEAVPAEALETVRDHWHRAWRAALPGCDPERASALLGPIAAARQAVIYRMFLDRIEPSEHGYHRSDPADWLARAAGLVRAER